MIVLGIDPGQSGGLALVDSEDIRGLIDAISMPLRNDTKKPALDYNFTYNWMMDRAGCDVDKVVIENVHAMPRQGVSSSFQFGRMFGGVEMLAQHFCDKPTYVTPQAWKGYYGLLKVDKNASIETATRLFNTDKYWKLKKHDGIAEAALMAAYGIALGV